MSVRVTSALWDIDLPSAQKFVLIILADHADDSGGNAYPSVARIARRCGCDMRTVQRALRELLAAGHISIERGPRDHTPTTYRIRGDFMPGRQDAGAAMCPSGVTPVRERGDTVPPEPSLNRPEPSKPKKRARPSRRCPPEFELTPDLRDYAVKRGMPPAEVDDQFEAFHTYEFPRTHSDWAATWQTWSRNYLKFSGPARGGGFERAKTRDEKTRSMVANLRSMGNGAGYDGPPLDGGGFHGGADQRALPRRLG